jgi:hypothetical protein
MHKEEEIMATVCDRKGIQFILFGVRKLAEKDTLRGIIMACAMNLHHYFGEGTKEAEKINSCCDEVGSTPC